MSDPYQLPVELSATLVLVRHGESAWIAEGRFQGRGNPPLSALGERQVALVAQRLAGRNDGVPLPIPLGPPLGIWHSPLRRAADTARQIAEHQPGPPPLLATGGMTEIGQGEWEGRLHAEVSAGWPQELARWRKEPTRAHAPGGEPLLAAAQRVRAALGEVTGALGQAMAQLGPRSRSDTSAEEASLQGSPVPGYPDPITADAGRSEPWAALVAHDGIFRLVLMNLLNVPYERFWSFPFSLCAISVIGLHEGVATLRAHNLTDHLAQLATDAVAAAEASGERRGAL